MKKIQKHIEQLIEKSWDNYQMYKKFTEECLTEHVKEEYIKFSNIHLGRYLALIDLSASLVEDFKGDTPEA